MRQARGCSPGQPSGLAYYPRFYGDISLTSTSPRGSEASPRVHTPDSIHVCRITIHEYYPVTRYCTVYVRRCVRSSSAPWTHLTRQDSLVLVARMTASTRCAPIFSVFTLGKTAPAGLAVIRGVLKKFSPALHPIHR